MEAGNKDFAAEIEGLSRIAEDVEGRLQKAGGYGHVAKGAARTPPGADRTYIGPFETIDLQEAQP